jgi:hypothetical protein
MPAPQSFGLARLRTTRLIRDPSGEANSAGRFIDPDGL